MKSPWIAWIILSPFLFYVALGVTTTLVVVARLAWELRPRRLRRS